MRKLNYPVNNKFIITLLLIFAMQVSLQQKECFISALNHLFPVSEIEPIIEATKRPQVKLKAIVKKWGESCA